jgi:hypothetical protein
MNLNSNVYVAKIDRRSVVLDLNSDRYIGLNADLTEVLDGLTSSADEDRQIPPEKKKAVAKLLDQGLLTNQHQFKNRCNLQKANAFQAAIAKPTASIWARLSDERTPNDRISISAMMSALVSLTQVATSLRFQPFKSTIDLLAKTEIRAPLCRSSSSAAPIVRAQALVDAFDEVRPYFPLKPICRLDAISLCLYLRRNGQAARLVLGVQLDPFRAHCWVQIGEDAVIEPWARVRQYTPILVV